MRLLLDTHIFLWYITGDERVSSHIRRAVEDSEAAYLSVVSLWEATIKYQLGKLRCRNRRTHGCPFSESSTESSRCRLTKPR